MKKKIWKKSVISAMCAAMMLAGMTACGSAEEPSGPVGTPSAVQMESSAVNESEGTGGNTTAVPGTVGQTENQTSGALDLLDQIWNTFGEQERFYAMGGDQMHPVDNKPGIYDLTEQAGMTNLYYIPSDLLGKVDDMATLLHAMNANTFTGAVFHLNGISVQDFADALKTNLDGVQWLCGSPEKLLIADLSNDYLLYAFGETSIMDDFAAKLTATHPDAKILYNATIEI